MKLGILTRKVFPKRCGIGDHSLLLARSLMLHGHEVHVFAGQGQPRDLVHIIDGDWDENHFTRFMNYFKVYGLDCIVLQYTPLLFSSNKGKINNLLETFWKSCSSQLLSVLIIHETYFWSWQSPKTWLQAILQKNNMYTLVSASHHVFTASELLFQELNQSFKSSNRINMLPIGSNIQEVKSYSKEKIRANHGLQSDELVITLFKGPTPGLKSMIHYISQLDKFLIEQHIKVRWLLLGGVPQKWFNFESPVLAYENWLEVDELSVRLKMSDIFLVTLRHGITAKRGTVMAALQHGLPIVALKGYMTDPFWHDAQGVNLVQVGRKKEFFEKVLRVALDQDLRTFQGNKNKLLYEKKFSWSKVAQSFLRTISC